MTLMTVREAAIYTGYSEGWLRRNLGQDKIEHVKEPWGDGGFRYLIDTRVLDGFKTREYKPRGRASKRWRYVVSIPPSDDAQEALIELVSQLPGATLRRGAGKLLVDNQEVE